MHIAYLVNQYPAVSHTFIRREIAALEELGVQVDRFTLRRVDGLEDPQDLAEVERTRAVLDVGSARLVAALERTAACRPIRFARASRLAATIGVGSERGLLRHGAYLAEACVLLDWLSESRATHVHAHFGTNSTAVAMLCHELGGPGYSFTAHGPEEFDKPGQIALAEKIRRARFVCGVSSFGRSQLYRHTAWHDWGKVHVVRCGLDPSYLEVDPVPVPEAPRLVCVGRLCEQKGQILLLEAVARLARRGVDFELVFVGDGEMRAEVESAAQRHGIGDRIRITGWAPGEVVRREILESRAFVLPSFAEGLPVAIMEALALARPVVTTYIAGIPELVETGACGWVVPAGSVDALERAVEQVLAASPADLDRLGREGQRRVREMHDVRISAGALHDLIRDTGIPGG